MKPLVHNVTSRSKTLLILLMATISGTAGAAVGPTLADAPLFSTVVVPANVILDISVEFPTAVGDAYLSASTYSSSTEFVGYFNPNFCYDYVQNTGTNAQTALFETLAGYYKPFGAASAHTCSGHWSGNYLNWILTQTIDPLRKTLTGGARIVDASGVTVLQKAYQDSQSSGGSNQNIKSITNAATVAGATPFAWPAIYSNNLNTGLNFVFNQVNSVAQSGAQTYTGSAGACASPNAATGAGSASSGSGINQIAITGGNSLTIRKGCTGTNAVKVTFGTGIGSVSLSTGALPTGVTLAPTLPTTISTNNTTTTLTFTVASTATAGTYSIAMTDKKATGTSPPTASFNLSLVISEYQAYAAQSAVMVCSSVDAPSDLETGGGRCRAYGATGYKPVGLMQKYSAESTSQSDSIRYSAFGYLLDAARTDTDQQLDGGVLRAKMKSVGPYKANPGQTVIANAANEWDAGTGVFVTNPDSADATASSVTNSGVVNYLNKFGFVPTTAYTATTRAAYKVYDSVGELYYMATRYYRNLGNLASHTTTATAITSGEATKDNFPVITTWDDPIPYVCSTNYIVGIGDIHTWNDENVPGATAKSSEEVSGSAPTDDAAVNATNATDYIANLEHIAGDTGGVTGRTAFYTSATGLGDALIGGIAAPSGGWGASQNSFYMAGLAFDVHVRDIRPDATTKTSPITVSTFWLDVMEGNDYHQKNQFWLTAKYGGFNTSSPAINAGAGWPIALNNSNGGNGSSAIANSYSTSFPTSTLASTALPLASWNTAGYTDDRGNYAPDQYFQASSPLRMASALNAAFAKIAASVPAGTSSALGLGSNSVSTSGNVNYISSYSNDWSGDVRADSLGITVTGSQLSTNTTTTTTTWDARNLLPPSTASGVLTYDTRVIATSTAVGAAHGAKFRTGTGGITTTQQAKLGTGATTQQAVLDYIRGNTCNEAAAGATLTTPCSGTSLGFRSRPTTVLGDITNSQPAVYGAPSLPYADAPLNPGYSTFKTNHSSRGQVLYVGANDGMLHAFDATPTSSGGKELFAYVPSALFTTNTDPNGNAVGLASLTSNPFKHHFMVDATPVVRDVDFDRTSSSPSSTAATDPSDWRTIVVSGLGKGGGTAGGSTVGGGYFAVDVTDPSTITTETILAGKVLWETDPASLTHMGYSYGLPHIVKTLKYGWTVVLTSGYDNDDGGGYIYLVSPKDGTLYEQIATGVGTTTAPAGLAHLVASIPNQSDFTADALYAGDLLGNVWRVDLTTTSTLSAVKFATVTDSSGVVQPITTYPLVSIDPTTQTRYVFVGTGKLLSDGDLVNSQTETFYGFIDGTNASFDKTSSFPITRTNLVADDPASGLATSALTAPTRGFFVDLAAAVTAGAGTQASAERINVQMVASGGVVLFGANLYGQNICLKGSSRVFALNYDSGLENVGMTLLQSSTSPSTLVSSLSYASGVVTNVTLVNGPASGTASSASTLTAMWGLDTTSGGAGMVASNSTGGDILLQNAANLRRINWREIPESQQ